jgi:hypothetical protein
VKRLSVRSGLLALAASLLALAGCGASAPPGPAEQQRRTVRDAQFGKCGESSPTARAAARDYRYSGSEGMEPPGCGSAP